MEVKTKFTGNDATLDSPLSSANRQQIEDAANAVLLALRLIRSQPICLYALRFSITNAFLDHVESSLPSDYGSCGRPGGLYKVTSEVVDEVRMLWPQAKKAIHEIATDSEWSLAVTRFGDAYRRTKGDDQLVDYWIALETLFLPEERAPEKGVAAGLAISNYLGESSADRRSLYASVKKSYTLRSRVVHGKTGTRDRDFDLEIDKTAELLRRSMLKRVREL